MKKRLLLAAVLSALGGGCTTQAADRQGHADMLGRDMMMDMSRADVNSDGALSKEEFLKAHEAMFDQMKNKDGLVRLDAMPAKCAQMMQESGGMMGGGMMGGGMMGGGMMGGGMMGGGMMGGGMMGGGMMGGGMAPETRPTPR